MLAAWQLIREEIEQSEAGRKQVMVPIPISELTNTKLEFPKTKLC